jgi:hypothetical protein
VIYYQSIGTTKVMNQYKLLLISDVEADRVFAQSAAEIAHISLIQGLESLRSKELDHCIVLVDVSTQEAYKEFEHLIKDYILDHTQPIHFIGSTHLHRSSYLAKKALFGNYLVRDTKNPSEAGMQYGRILKASLDYSAFGVQRFLKPSTQLETLIFTNTNQKQPTEEVILDQLCRWGFTRRMSQIIATGVDELLMNAMFDAPVDENGKAIYEQASRNTEIELKLRSAVHLNYGFDGDYVVFGVTDHFGSLHRLKLLSYLSKMQDVGPYVVSEETAGAGIGISSIHLAGGSLFFVSKAQEKTEVILLFKKTSDFIEFKKQFKFIATQFYI